MIDKLFGSALRLKLMKFFVFNPAQVFDVKIIARKVEARLPAVKKEIRILLAAKLIKVKVYKNEKGRKQKGVILDNNFGHVEALKEFLMKVSPLSETQISDKLSKAGRLKFATLSGVFINNPDCRVDLLIVGINLKRMF